MFLRFNGQEIPCVCYDPEWAKYMVKNNECTRCGQHTFNFGGEAHGQP